MRQPAVPHIGHLLTSEGLKRDPSKVAAVRTMPTPKNKDDVTRFLRFVFYFAKFIPNLSELDSSLREPLTMDPLFDCQPSQKDAPFKPKAQCYSQPMLKYFVVRNRVEVQCDANQHGLGAVLIQDGQPIIMVPHARSSILTSSARKLPYTTIRSPSNRP